MIILMKIHQITKIVGWLRDYLQQMQFYLLMLSTREKASPKIVQRFIKRNKGNQRKMSS